MAAAAAGLRVALVDGDCKAPTLCEILRLELEHGWIDCVRRGLPIKEVAVHAIEDGVTLIPLMAPSDVVGAASATETTRLIDRLRDYFDLVIVDGPVGSSSDIDQCGGAFDSAVIVCNPARTGGDEVKEVANRLTTAGVVGIGMVENFA
jgi:MinD-like ATPase involved in chromosome partitioning or flagellar assembly